MCQRGKHHAELSHSPLVCTQCSLSLYSSPGWVELSLFPRTPILFSSSPNASILSSPLASAPTHYLSKQQSGGGFPRTRLRLFLHSDRFAAGFKHLSVSFKVRQTGDLKSASWPTDNDRAAKNTVSRDKRCFLSYRSITAINQDALYIFLTVNGAREKKKANLLADDCNDWWLQTASGVRHTIWPSRVALRLYNNVTLLLPDSKQSCCVCVASLRAAIVFSWDGCLKDGHVHSSEAQRFLNTAVCKKYI